MDELPGAKYARHVSVRPLCVLVDDDPDFLRFAQQVIARLCPRCEVAEFCNGLDALEYLARHAADLLVTDYRMPLIDGLRLTASVRSFAPTLTIVVMSADNVEAQAMAKGATAFVPKRDMLQRLSAVLQRCAVLGPPPQ